MFVVWHGIFLESLGGGGGGGGNITEGVVMGAEFFQIPGG